MNQDNLPLQQAPSAPQFSKRIYPIIQIERNKNPNRQYAFPVLGGLMKAIMIIPQIFMLWFAYLVWSLALFVNVFVVLLKGHYWQQAYNWGVKFVQFSIKIGFFMNGMTDKYPGFTYKIQDTYTVNIPYPTVPNRLYAVPLLGYLIRQIFLFPFTIYALVISNAASVMVTVSSLAVAFRGYYPESTYEMVRDSTRLTASEFLYFSGISDTHPSFKISKNHLLLKIVFIILSAILVTFNIAQDVGDFKGEFIDRNDQSDEVVMSTPIDIKSCEADAQCFFAEMEQNRKVSATLFNSFSVEGISFMQPVDLLFEGYENGAYFLRIKSINVFAVGGNNDSLATNPTVRNVKEIAIGNETSCSFTTENFESEMIRLKNEPIQNLGFPQSFYACTASLIPYSATKINEFLNVQQPTPTTLPSIPIQTPTPTISTPWELR